MRSLVSPLPAIAAGTGPFIVTGISNGSSASCGLPSDDHPGIFNVPLETGSIQALAVRMHELGHLGLVRIGAVPDDLVATLEKAKIHFGWIQFALDVVVNAFMIARGNREVSLLKLWSGTLPAEMPRWLAAMEFLRAEGLSRELAMRMSLQARAQFTSDELELLCSRSRLLQKLGAGAVPISVKELRTWLRGLQKTFGPDSREANHFLLEDRVIISVRSRGRKDALSSRINEWGAMVFSHPQLCHCCAPTRRVASRKIIASYCGAFRFPHRALLPAADGRVFALKKRIHGGCILIDCSGSMNLTADALRSVVSRSPAATTAVYAGLPGDESGLLLVVARDGRFADIEELTSSFGGGNIVDGPALRWLATQHQPRIWISDGHVTGRGDNAAANLDAEVNSIVRSARIRRIRSLEQLG